MVFMATGSTGVISRLTTGLYFSRQHGAYITIIALWLASVLLSRSADIRQWMVIILMLSGLNAVELVSEMINRKSRMAVRKKNSFAFYAVTSLGSMIVLSSDSPLFLLVVLASGFVVAIYTLAAKFRMQKNVFVELLIFSSMSLTSLLSLEPGSVALPFYIVFLIFTVYACSSIFTVKFRMGKLGTWPGIIFLVLSVFLLVWFPLPEHLQIGMILLLTLKILLPYLFAEKYRLLSMPTIGIIESAGHILFLVILLRFQFEPISTLI